jgi:rubrerythrin
MFFRKYGERFEDSEGKQIFMEFAEEEREHRDLLIREYYKLRERLGLRKASKRMPPARTTH